MPYVEEIPAARSIRPLPASVTGFVGACDAGPIDTPVVVTSAGEYHTIFGPSLDPGRPLGHAVELFFANGGRRLTVVRAASPAPDHLVPGAAGGVHALADSGITVLAVPGLTADHHLQVSTALALCASWRAVLVLDLPPSPFDDGAGAAARQTGPHRERAAAYHPWLVTGGVAVPPSGAVAGVIARTDAERGIWKAPAGVVVHGLDGFTEALDDVANEAPLHAGVNAMREFPGRGRLVWGARTLAGADSAEPARRYLPMRRLTDHVLGSLAAGLEFVVFEPNEAPLWLLVKQLVESFLNELWRAGAFPGDRPQDAYGARCGLGETMTHADMQDGRLVVEVHLATMRPAEFDVHRLTFQTQG